MIIQIILRSLKKMLQNYINKNNNYLNNFKKNKMNNLILANYSKENRIIKINN